MKKYKNLIRKTQTLYSLPPIINWKFPERGVENINLILTTKNNQKYILRRYTWKDANKKNLQERIDLKLLLEKNNFPTRRVYKNINGNYFFKYQGRYNALFSYIEARHPSDDDIKANLKLAPLIARLHLITKNFKLKHNLQDWTIPSKNELKKYQSLRNDRFWGMSKQEILREMWKYINLVKKKSLPRGVVHADLHGSNLLVDKNNKLYIIDFDDLHISELVKDLAFPIRGILLNYQKWTKELESNISKIIKSYEKTRKLSKPEKENLINIVKRDLLTTAIWQIYDWKKGRDKYKKAEKIAKRHIKKYQFIERNTDKFQELIAMI